MSLFGPARPAARRWPRHLPALEAFEGRWLLACSYQNAILDLGSLDGGTTSPHAINNQGEVVGQSDVSGGAHAFLYPDPANPGTMKDLGTLGPSGNSTAWAINNSGTIVGAAAATAPGGAVVDHAFRSKNGAKLTDLDVGDPNWASTAISVNDASPVQVGGDRVAPDRPHRQRREQGLLRPHLQLEQHRRGHRQHAGVHLLHPATRHPPRHVPALRGRHGAVERVPAGPASPVWSVVTGAPTPSGKAAGGRHADGGNAAAPGTGAPS
jgi:probable HAF family extracellular repeat protein